MRPSRFTTALVATVAMTGLGCAVAAAPPRVTVSGIPFETVATGTVDYAVPPPDSIEELVEQAEVVVRAVARDVEMFGDAATPVTEQTFEVVEVVVGDLDVGDAVTVSMLGGVVERVFYEFEAEPQFATAAEYLLALRTGPDGLFRVVGPTAGRYRIEDGTLLDHEVDLSQDDAMRVGEPLHRRLRATTTHDPTQGELLSGMGDTQAIAAIQEAAG